MKNEKTLLNHAKKYFAERRADAAKAKKRYNSRGVLCDMTPAGYRAEVRALDKKEAAALDRIARAAACGAL